MENNALATSLFQSELCPDCKFPSSNMLGVPDLRLDMQAEFADIPFVCFGEQKRTFQMNNTGTLHFYTDDYRFTAIYEHPERVLQHHPRNIVEPNFSLFQDMEPAFGLQAIYKKRWIARMMQEKGIRVFVDLNVASKFYKLNLLGVPFGWTSYCTRGYSDRLEYLEFEYMMAKKHSGGNSGFIFVIYNGGQLCRQFALTHAGCVYMDPMSTIKKKKKALQQIEETVLFADVEELTLDYLLPSAIAAIDAGQATFSPEQSLKFIKMPEEKLESND